ncbi:hypothetical protein NPIL_167391 [Nephila pilipes]|uniref:Uncharacterized protein n=1 Tax=Nephila pilipes TaxID=299642 RepID=A0A8X6MRI1_NEPPI|nr:hypothetical protein NPIL_167391 [Nephila pilipes]
MHVLRRYFSSGILEIRIPYHPKSPIFKKAPCHVLQCTSTIVITHCEFSRNLHRRRLLSVMLSYLRGVFYGGKGVLNRSKERLFRSKLIHLKPRINSSLHNSPPGKTNSKPPQTPQQIHATNSQGSPSTRSQTSSSRYSQTRPTIRKQDSRKAFPDSRDFPELLARLTAPSDKAVTIACSDSKKTQIKGGGNPGMPLQSTASIIYLHTRGHNTIPKNQYLASPSFLFVLTHATFTCIATFFFPLFFSTSFSLTRSQKRREEGKIGSAQEAGNRSLV